MNECCELKNFIANIEDGIAILTVNRPEVRNALNPDCFRDIGNFMDYAENNDDIRVIIITGSGEKAFAAGADVKSLKVKTGVENLRSVSKEALLKIENSSKPVIAAINGVAFGGGCELSLACDIRIVSNNALLGFPETNLGIIPGAGGTQRLSRIIGIGRAKEIILGGRVISAEEAVYMGFAMKNVPIQNLIPEAVELAKVIIKKGPIALSIAKKVLNASMFTDLNTGLLLESLAFSVLLDTKDKLEGTTAFLEKRPPNFQGN